MNKFAKRLLTGVLAGALATSMALPAFAAEQDKTLSVSGIESGDTVNFYQVIKWDTATNNWALADGFNSLTLENLTDGAIDQQDAKAIVTAANSATAAQTNTQTTFNVSTVDKAGLYLVLIEPGTNNKTTLYNPVFVSSDFDLSNGTNTIDISKVTSTTYGATVKKDTPKVDKSIVTEDQKDVNVGDTVNFKVETTIPAYATYIDPKFVVSDTVTDGLEIDTGTIKVDGIDAKNYEIKSPTKSGYTIEFKKDYLTTIASSQKVTITYSAKVTDSAEQNVNEMTNTAELQYSNNPKDTSGNGTAGDKTKHYTFSIDASLLGKQNYQTSELVKVAVDENGNAILDEKTLDNNTKVHALAGAQFALFTDEACQTPYKQNNEAVTATSDNNGHIAITGLDAGTYYLKETKAPDGFLVSDKVVKIEITAEYENKSETVNGTEVTYQVLKSYTVAITGGDTNASSTYTMVNDATGTITSVNGTDATATLKNVRAAGLPTTGGMGTTIFYIAGIVLVGGAAILLVTRRRMSAR